MVGSNFTLPAAPAQATPANSCSGKSNSSRKPAAGAAATQMLARTQLEHGRDGSAWRFAPDVANRWLSACWLAPRTGTPPPACPSPATFAMLFARINVMRRAVGSGARAAGTLRTAARAAGAVIPGALVRSSGVSGFHVEDDAIMNEQDALGLQVGFMSALDVLTLTTRLLRTTGRYKTIAIPAAAPSGRAALCYGQTSGARSFSSQAGGQGRPADQKEGGTSALRTATKSAAVAGGLAAASSTFAAVLCTINCTVVPALAAVLPALSGAASASASASASTGDAACSSCEATLPFLGVSVTALKTFTVSS